MMSSTGHWQDLDRRFVWHPFTPMRDWCASDPLVLVSGRGALLTDSEGNEYIDGNSSIWTNIHGHNNPRLDAAIKRQLAMVAHTSFLGFTNPSAAELAAKLCALWPDNKLSRCFFSDDGSTAIEAALKIAAQYWQLVDKPEKNQFVAFQNAYHGDTMGAASLGDIARFHERFQTWHFPAKHAASLKDLEKWNPKKIAAVCIEPLIQGAAGMQLWPAGQLAALRKWCTQNEVLLIADEVMTGFGRTGKMFACEHEGVVPDMVALAKGLTGGYMPLAATLISENIFSAFLGDIERTLYYGHSYCGNALGCAVALESLAIFREENVLGELALKIKQLAESLAILKRHPNVRATRQCGFIAGIDITQPDGKPFPTSELRGGKVCLAARKHGLLTRPVRDTIVLMPPLCISSEELQRAVRAIELAITEVCQG